MFKMPWEVGLLAPGHTWGCGVGSGVKGCHTRPRDRLRGAAKDPTRRRRFGVRSLRPWGRHLSHLSWFPIFQTRGSSTKRFQVFLNLRLNNCTACGGTRPAVSLQGEAAAPGQRRPAATQGCTARSDPSGQERGRSMDPGTCQGPQLLGLATARWLASLVGTGNSHLSCPWLQSQL